MTLSVPTKDDVKLHELRTGLLELASTMHERGSKDESGIIASEAKQVAALACEIHVLASRMSLERGKVPPAVADKHLANEEQVTLTKLIALASLIGTSWVVDKGSRLYDVVLGTTLRIEAITRNERHHDYSFELIQTTGKDAGNTFTFYSKRVSPTAEMYTLTDGDPRHTIRIKRL